MASTEPARSMIQVPIPHDTTRPRRFRRSRGLALALIAVPCLAGTVRAQQAVLDGYAMGARDATRHRLPADLTEVSGLAVTDDGRLLAHDDERAEIRTIDTTTGGIVATFGLGRLGLAGDFEGIASAGDRVFLITSAGVLYEFPLAADGERTEYRRVDTGLGPVCEVEGLDHDSRTASLLIVCKQMYEGGPPGIYGFDLRRGRLEARPRFALRDAGGRPLKVNPSGIAVHPESGNLIVVAARQRRLIELDRAGRVLANIRLRGSHPQPEGIAFLPDGTLAIADEGAGGRARLALYPRATSPP